jgi:hypothetical protein
MMINLLVDDVQKAVQDIPDIECCICPDDILYVVQI